MVDWIMMYVTRHLIVIYQDVCFTKFYEVSIEENLSVIVQHWSFTLIINFLIVSEQKATKNKRPPPKKNPKQNKKPRKTVAHLTFYVSEKQTFFEIPINSLVDWF